MVKSITVKRCLTTLLAVIVFFGLFTSQALAAAPTRDDFPGCVGPNNQAQCSCRIAIRRKDDANPQNYFVVDGVKFDNILPPVVGVNRNIAQEYAIFSSKPRSNADADDCYTVQEVGNQPWSWSNEVLECAPALIGCIIPGDFLPEFSATTLTEGFWDPIGRSTVLDCRWGDNDGSGVDHQQETNGNNGWTITREWRPVYTADGTWEHADDGTKKNIGRISFQGKRGQGEFDKSIPDEFYCGFLLVRNGFNTLDGEISNTPFNLCAQIPEGEQRTNCQTCADKGSIWTAIGCISTEPVSMTQTLVTIGLSIGGGVSILMILAAGFKFSISQGDPKQTSDAKEMMTSAIVGLLFIIFSITILQFIGVSIFRLPGFGEG